MDQETTKLILKSTTDVCYSVLGEFHASTKSMESEKTILAKCIAPNLSVFLEKLQ